MEVMARAHALEAQGRRIIHMEIGEPDFTAPPPVVAAAGRAMRDGMTSYASRLAVTAGASGGLLLAFALLVDPGNEVLVPDPGYPGFRFAYTRSFADLEEGIARLRSACAGCVMRRKSDGPARLDQHLRKAGTLRENFCGVRRVGVVERPRVHLQRALGPARAAQIFAQNLRTNLNVGLRLEQRVLAAEQLDLVHVEFGDDLHQPLGTERALRNRIEA
jgi:hypothetical protein